MTLNLHLKDSINKGHKMTNFDKQMQQIKDKIKSGDKETIARIKRIADTHWNKGK